MTDLELPGFRYDPIKKRYFALTPQELQCPQTRNLTPEPCQIPVIRTRSKHQRFKNSPYLLSGRQLGFTNPTSFETDLLDMKVLDIKLSEEINLTEFSEMEAVLFLKATPHSIILHYQKDPTWKTVLAEYHHRFTPDRFQENSFDDAVFGSFVTINDVSVGFKNSDILMYVGSNMKLNFGMATKSFRPIHEHNIANDNRGFKSSSPIWCCASNDFTEKFAIGMRSMFTIHALSDTPQIRDVRGSVHGITFDKMGNLVYCGINCGRVSLSDLRIQGSSATEMSISEYGIQEVVLLEDENYLICADFAGALCKIDLRMQKKIMNYVEHFFTPLKTSLSVNEKHNLLCATGTDHITRFWSLSSGEYPLNRVKPGNIADDGKTSSCFISDGYKLSTFIVHNNLAWIYDIFS